MQSPAFKAWRESWLHVIKGLERGESIWPFPLNALY
jgi:hypothetical protein